jgi:hypothetical protein
MGRAQRYSTSRAANSLMHHALASTMQNDMPPHCLSIQCMLNRFETDERDGGGMETAEGNESGHRHSGTRDPSPLARASGAAGRTIRNSRQPAEP